MLQLRHNKGAKMKFKPTVFLDVDGVINSLNHLFTGGRVEFGWPTPPHEAGDYTVWVPEYMPHLVQAMYQSTDLHWLTTWRHQANKHISPILGIPGDVPVIDDNTNKRTIDWKATACRPHAELARIGGRTVYWIEDFNGYPHKGLEGIVIQVDTSANGEDVLLPQHLPAVLLQHLYDEGGYDGPSHVVPPSRNLNGYSVTNTTDIHGITTA